MRVLPSGSRALLLEMGSLNEVLAQYAALQEMDLPILDLVPAGRTLLVVGERGVDLGKLEDEIVGVVPGEHSGPVRATVEVPVRYDGQDLRDASRLLGLTPEELVRRHLEEDWKVAFCGFAPGFSYITGARFDWTIPRRSSPRTHVPAGALALAGGFTAIYPRESPGGWQLIGHALGDMFDLDRDPPSLLLPGSPVRFVELP